MRSCSVTPTIIMTLASPPMYLTTLKLQLRSRPKHLRTTRPLKPLKRLRTMRLLKIPNRALTRL